VQNLLKSPKTTWILFVLFSLHQSYYIFIGGTTYDTISHRFASGKILNKILTIFSGNLGSPSLKEFSTGESFGFLVMLPSYIFGHSMRILNEKLKIDVINKFFTSDDSIVYFFMNISLNIYIAISLVVVYFILKRFYGALYANLFLIFIILTPSFIGHSLFNFKDIPFAINLLICNLLLLHKFNFLESTIRFKDIIQLAFVFSLPSLIRPNGILFSGLTLFYLLLINYKKIKAINLFRATLVVLGSLFFVYIFTPQAWLRPDLFLDVAIKQQFFHGWTGATLTNGIFIEAQDISWNYLLIWFSFRLPIIFILGFVAFTYMKFKRRKFSIIADYSYFFICTMLLFFSILKPTAYDGLRQFLFLVPYFVLIFTELITNLPPGNKVFYNVIIFSIFYLIFTQFGLKETKYSYFNEFTDLKNISYFCEENIDGCGDWPTDYWGFSGKSLAGEINSLNGPVNVITCKPFHSINSYLNENINIIDSGEIESQDYSEGIYYVATFHRPRLNDDSCYFVNKNINYSCENISTVFRKIRNQKIVMAYLNLCNLTYHSTN
jgi:hypothetical protein